MNVDLPPMDWTGAVCATVDPEMWFPEHGHSPAPAIALCNECPLKAACLAVAVANPDLYGVWGGTTAKDRVALRVAAGATPGGNARPREPHGTPAAARRHWRAREPLCEPCRTAANADRAARKAAHRDPMAGAA